MCIFTRARSRMSHRAKRANRLKNAREAALFGARVPARRDVARYRFAHIYSRACVAHVFACVAREARRGYCTIQINVLNRGLRLLSWLYRRFFSVWQAARLSCALRLVRFPSTRYQRRERQRISGARRRRIRPNARVLDAYFLIALSSSCISPSRSASAVSCFTSPIDSASASILGSMTTRRAL